MSQQQQEQQQQPQQQQQQQQQQCRLLRQTYKCCNFCAKRKRRCDGLLPRCSFCIEKRQPDCHYRPKQPPKVPSKVPPKVPPKVNPKETSAPRRKVPSSAKKPAVSTRSTPGGTKVPGVRQHHALGLSPVVSLKRCRLSVSPATGLVGVQENAFLNDYFECLGFLPLASASMVREAVFNVMLGSMPRKRQERGRVGGGSFARRQEGDVLQEVEEGGVGQALAYRPKEGDPSTCILWCTIALGALVQGCPLEFVTGYVTLARASLAECFDGTSIETARAFLVMSILYSFLGEEEEKMKYSAFASSMVAGMDPETLPMGMRNMLLTVADRSKLFLFGGGGSGAPAKPKAIPEDIDDIPPVKEIVHGEDLCNLVILTNRCLNRALHKDLMCGEGTRANTQQTGADRHVSEVKRSMGTSDDQREPGGVAGGQDGEVRGLEAPLKSGSCDRQNAKDFPDTPCAGEATRAFVKSALPYLGRLSRAMERSDALSGVGGLIYLGDTCYMKLLQGDVDGVIEGITTCAKVLVRFPGICRYRPHLVHCVLAGAASGMYRSVYNPVRDAYNSILPGNCPPAPPLEEWGGMSCICDYVFCRYLQMELHRVSFGSNSLDGVDEGDVAASAPNSRPSAPDEVPPSDEVTLPPKDPSQTPPRRGVHVPAGRGGQLDAASETNPLTPSEDERLFGNTRVDRGGRRSIGAAVALQPSAPGVRGEGVSFGLPGGPHSGSKEEGRPQATRLPLAPSGDPDSPVVDGGDWCGPGVEVHGVPHEEHDVAGVDTLSGWELGSLGEEWKSVGIGFTGADLVHAAEVLMSSSPLDDELWEGTDACS